MKLCGICGRPVASGPVVHKGCLPSRRPYRYYRLVCDDGYWRVLGSNGVEPLSVESAPAIFADGMWHTVSAILGLEDFDADRGPWEKEAVNE